MKKFVNLVIDLIKKFILEIIAVLTSSTEESNANRTINNININTTVKGEKKVKKRRRKKESTTKSQKNKSS